FSLRIGVDTAEDHVGVAQALLGLLPASRYGLDFCVRIQCENDATCHFDLWRFVGDVLSCCADQSVQVRVADDVGIGYHVRFDADVRELLNDMRAASAQSDDPYSYFRKDRRAVSAEKALAGEIPAHIVMSSSRSGVPTISIC